MVDPFSTPAVQTEDGYHRTPRGIFHFLEELLDSLVENGRFKEDEIEGAFKDTDHSRFIISPRRRADKGASVQPALASTGLRHFAGLLHRKLRSHDFCLGRRNAQKFLRNRFVLSKNDAVNNNVIDTSTLRENASAVPIIPLVGTAAEEIPHPSWPEISQCEKDQLVRSSKNLLKTRLNKVIENLMDDLVLETPTKPNKCPKTGPPFPVGAIFRVVGPVTQFMGGKIRDLVLSVVRGVILKKAVTKFERAVDRTLEAFLKKSEKEEKVSL